MAGSLTDEELLPRLVEQVRATFGADCVAVLRHAATRGWSRPQRASRSRPRPTSADAPSHWARIASSPCRRAAARRGPPAARRGRRPGRPRPRSGAASESRPPRPPSWPRPTTCGRAPAGGLPRPPHAARLDQGLHHQPAPVRRHVGRPRQKAAFPRPSRRRPTGSPASSSNLLDMSRLQAGVLTPPVRETASRRWCPPLCRAGRRGPTSRARRRPRPPEVTADPVLLERVVANLVTTPHVSPDGHAAAGRGGRRAGRC